MTIISPNVYTEILAAAANDSCNKYKAFFQHVAFNFPLSIQPHKIFYLYGNVIEYLQPGV